MLGMLKPVTDHSRTKHALRRASRASRRDRSDAEQDRLARGLRDRLLSVPEVAAARRVAAFVSQDGEPGTGPLMAALSSAGVDVLLPILRDDNDLDWAPYVPRQLAPGRFGLLVPTTEPVGVDAVASSSVVICPGVAVDLHGNRLGRGGGSYDRVLARCGPDVLRIQLAYDDEVVDGVPAEPHDQPVAVIVTPTRVLRVSRQAPG